MIASYIRTQKIWKAEIVDLNSGVKFKIHCSYVPSPS